MTLQLTDRQRRAIGAAASEHHTPSYLYFERDITERVAELRSAFPDWGLSFAVKSNPNRALLAILETQCEHLDVSSGGEMLHAVDAGWDPSRFTFVGPAKTPWELDLAVRLGCGFVVCESLAEVDALAEIAKGHGTTQQILLRVNPISVPKGFGLAMSGRSTAFGVDEEHIDEAVKTVLGVDGVALVGFHLYAGSMCLDEDALVENIEWTAALFGRLVTTHDIAVDQLVFGSGFGIPYRDEAEPFDLTAVATRSKAAIDELRSLSQVGDAHLSLEIGRYIVGEAGLFLTSVLGVKAARKSDVVIVDGGMNAHLAGIGQVGVVVPRAWPMVLVAADGGEIAGETEKRDLAGPLCTPVDSFGHGVALPSPSVGDILVIGASGAYGPSYSPTAFISHRPPAELLVSDADDGELVLTDITARGPAGPPPARLLDEWGMS